MDVKELPSGALVLAVDMPRVRPADVRVQVEDGNVLTISGERKRPAADEDAGAEAGKQQHHHQKQKQQQQQAAKEGASEKPRVKYLRMERQVPADGAADGQVHEAVPTAGGRRPGQHQGRAQGRRAHRHRRQEAAAGAQEAARRPGHGRRAPVQVKEATHACDGSSSSDQLFFIDGS